MTRVAVGVVNRPYHYRIDTTTTMRLFNLVLLCVLAVIITVVADLKDFALAATLNPSPSTTATTSTAACAPLHAPANGIVAYSTPLGARQFAPPGTLARTACLAGYELIVPSSSSNNNNVARITAQCTSSGQWNSSTADGQRPPHCALNVALGMPTLMSSTAHNNINNSNTTAVNEHPYETTATVGTGGGGGWLAVDGSLAFCAKSQLEHQPWWQVQLDRPYSIAMIKVTLGAETMIDQQHIEVLLINTSYATPANVPPAAQIHCAVVKSVATISSRQLHPQQQHLQTLYADCSRGGGALQSGHFVVVRSAVIAAGEQATVQQHQQRLHLCEVEVFSDEARTCSHPGNPRNGLVKLSSDTWPYVPGTQAVYECDEGYTRLPFNSAHFHRRCQANGEWTEQQPTCEMDVALYKFARQGSNFSSNAYPAWHAVDGDPTTCSWTRRESNPWLLIDLLDTYEIKALAVLLDKERLFYDFHRKNLELAFFNTTTDLAVNAALAYANADEQARQNIRRLAGRQNERAAGTYAPLFLTAADIGYEFLEFAQIDLNSLGSGIFVMQRPVTARSVLITPSSFVGSSGSPSTLSPKYLGVCDIKVYTNSAVPPVASRCGALGDGASSAFLYTRSNTASSTCLQVERYHSATWDGAQHACATRGGSLIKHIDRTAQAHVGLVLDHLYRFHDTADAYWIGARKRTTMQQQQQQVDGGEEAFNALVSAQPWQWVSSSVNADNGNNNNLTQTILPNDFTFWNNQAAAVGGDVAAETAATNTAVVGAEAPQCAAMGGESISDWSWTNYRCSREANWICEYPVRGCSSPQLPPGVLIDRTFYEYLETGKWESGDELQLVCEPGHIAKAERNLKCEPNGLWSGVAECKAVDCGPPPTLAGAHFLLLNGTTTYGSKVHYVCAAPGPASPPSVSTYAVITCSELGWQSLTLSCNSNDPALYGRSTETDADFSAPSVVGSQAFTPQLPKSNISSQQQQQQPSFMFADPVINNEPADVGGPNFQLPPTLNTPPSWLPPRVEMKTVTPLPLYTRHVVTSTAAITPTPVVADDADPVFNTDDTTTTPSSGNGAVVIIPTSSRNGPEQQMTSRMAPTSGGGLSVGGGIAIGFGAALLLMAAVVGLVWQFARQIIADKFGIFITGPAIGGGSSDTSSDRHAASSNHHSNSTAADSVSHQQQFHHVNQLGGVQMLTTASSNGTNKAAFHLLAPPLDYQQHRYVVSDDGSTAAAQYASAVIMLNASNPHNMGTIRLGRNAVITGNENDDGYSNANNNNALESHYYASHTYATAAAALATAQQQQQQQRFEDDEGMEQQLHRQLNSAPQSSSSAHTRQHLPENSFSDSSSGASSPRQAALTLQNITQHNQYSDHSMRHQTQNNTAPGGVIASEYVSTTLSRRHQSMAQPPPPPPLPHPIQLSTASSTSVQHPHAFTVQYRDSAYNSSLSGDSISGSHHPHHLQLTPLSHPHYDVVGNLNGRLSAKNQVVSISRKPSSLLSAASAIAVQVTPNGRKPLAGGVPVLPQIRDSNFNNTVHQQQLGSNIIHAFDGNSTVNDGANTLKPVVAAANVGVRKPSKPYQRPQAYHTTKERRSSAAAGGGGGAFTNSSAFWPSPSTSNVNDETMPKPSRAGLLMSSISATSPSNRQQPQYVKTLGRTAMQKLVRKAARALSTTSDAPPATTSLSVADLFSAASNGNGPQTNPNGSSGGGSRCRTPGSTQNLRLMPMISGPIECRKTVLINGGTPASQVIYATDDCQYSHQQSLTAMNDEHHRRRMNSSSAETDLSGQPQQFALDSDFADSLIYDCLPDGSKEDEDVLSQYQKEIRSINGRKQQSDAISSATTISTSRQPTNDLNGSTPGVSEKSLTSSLLEELQRRIKNTSSLDDLSPTNSDARKINKTLHQSKVKPARQHDDVASSKMHQQVPPKKAGGDTLPRAGGYESEGCYFDDEFEEEIYGSSGAAQRGASLAREQHVAAVQQQKVSNLPPPGFSTRQNPVFVTPYMTAYDLKSVNNSGAVTSHNGN